MYTCVSPRALHHPSPLHAQGSGSAPAKRSRDRRGARPQAFPRTAADAHGDAAQGASSAAAAAAGRSAHAPRRRIPAGTAGLAAAAGLRAWAESVHAARSAVPCCRREASSTTDSPAFLLMTERFFLCFPMAFAVFLPSCACRDFVPPAGRHQADCVIAFI